VITNHQHQTDRRTDGRHAIARLRFALVHCAVITIRQVHKTLYVYTVSLGSRRQLEVVSQVQLIVDRDAVATSDTVRDLGFTVDVKLSMKCHVDGVARNCFNLLRQLRSIRRSVPTDALHTLVYAFSTSRIDYCNAVVYRVYGVTDTVIRRLYRQCFTPLRDQSLQGSDGTTTSRRVTLHWLPVSQRINYLVAFCWMKFCKKVKL